MNSNFFSVIVTYNPDVSTLVDLINVLSESDVVPIVVDNGSKSLDFIDAIKNSKVHFFYLNSNKGIAFAQNVGINFAIKSLAKKIIFFDHDSKIDKDFIKNINNDYELIKSSGEPIAAIGPKFIDTALKLYSPGLVYNKVGLLSKIDISHINFPIEVAAIISSGSLVSVETFGHTGLMNEDLFIDYVDTEWCFRASSLGFKFFISNSAIMYHSIGENTIKFFKTTFPVHSARRRYYRVRNIFLMWNMIHIKKIWLINMLFNNLIVSLMLCILEKDKFSYIRFFLLAIKDGLSGKKGSL
ncbi:glycosyltransferase family 2 protein [Acinetobacter sp. A2]|uniref:glycosyltransferase family 2 protein n=1 Tax=Acinetobacter sp. A2 TaxID=362457 RepID=UPI003AF37554